ncbi:hypothetical protein HJC23_011285 [Cyclotella cryptica]|uniref:Mitochondrial splicing suppressor 51-like C-terminal domain-containing protein n=1 Tax=Cyclotella cryptica TaxID=29204 RepID=A0ABD3QVH4_9STRA|eukprot:CCRYP_001692-RA/>CCRYP_001692-RA protein AED:0.03 eAED:0.03 QI:421/1/1/1/0.5/0.33/3/1371/660
MSNNQIDNEPDDSSRQPEDANDANEIIHQVDVDDGREDDEEGEAAITSYMMEGYTPLNFNMNAFTMADGSDDEDSDHGRERQEGDRDEELFSNGYYHLGAPNRRINGVKSHAGEFASSFQEETDGRMVNEAHHSDSDNEDFVPSDFHSLADRVLRGLDDEHRVTLQRSDQEANAISTLVASAPDTIRADDQQSINFIADFPSENKEDDDAPIFEANFPTTQISAEAKSSVGKPSTSRRIPAAKMNPTNNDKIEAKKKTMDINAIKKAMQSIRVKSPQFASTLDAGSSSSSTAVLAYKAATRVSYNALIHSTCLAIQERQNALEQSQQKFLSHPIIPTGPLAAFRRSTPKAYAASHNLSRSATLAEAFVRLWPLICFRRRISAMKERGWSTDQHEEHPQEEATSTRTLTIHIIGADGVECSSDDTVRNSVGPFVRWLDAALHSGALSDSLSGNHSSHAVEGSKLLIEFSGPNMPENMVGKEIDLLPRTHSDYLSKGLDSATCVFYRREYHETASSTIGSTMADFTVAFNAGIWGYDSWKPTLAYMMRKSVEPLQPSMQAQHEIVKGTLFVVTAYTYEECEDDADVIAGLAQDVAQENDSAVVTSNNQPTSALDERSGRIAHQLWAPENNFFSSRMERKTASALPGRRYFENGAWQAWLFGS